jgi:hypothetical protein
MKEDLFFKMIIGTVCNITGLLGVIVTLNPNAFPASELHNNPFLCSILSGILFSLGIFLCARVAMVYKK